MPPRRRRRHEEKDRAAATRLPEINWLRRLLSGRALWLLFIAVVLLFYGAPLFEEHATVQWDAADYHLSAQKYFAEHIRSGRLPHWTPYPYSGMPFLADIQVGAWYPLNWPFFLIGITPRAIQWELALHCLVALAGAFVLARKLTGDAVAALFAGVLYAFSGYFAAHSSHVGMFQAAALLPWLLWAGVEALGNLRWISLTAIVAASLFLAGHFQTALYAMTALGLFLLAQGLLKGVAWWRIAMVLVCSTALALGLSAVQVLPGLELARESNRAVMDFSRGSNSELVPGALLTLVDPDHYHAPKVEKYDGPEDVTQFYFYQGLLLLPLAALGVVKGRAFSIGAFAVPALWYAFGPPAGLYLLVSRLPGFRGVRAPVHAWFVVALALALLAACGAMWLVRRFPQRWLPIALLAFCVADLWYWNMANNHLAYARASFDELYGELQQRFQTVSDRASSDPLRRIWAPAALASFGPMNGMLDGRIEVTYGYNPFELRRYTTYLEAAKGNPRLLDSLAVTHRLNMSSGSLDTNPDALARVSAPPGVVRARSRSEAAARLRSLDPAKEMVIEGPATASANNAQARIVSYTGSEYRIAYQAASPALLRIAVPYFAGWRAEVDGGKLDVFAADLALTAVGVPAGNHELVFRYESNWFATGALISAPLWIGVALWFVWPALSRYGWSGKAAFPAEPA